MAEKILQGENKVKRHGFSVLFVHWTVAISTFLLILSGFGQMPMYKRYHIADLPGMSWSADYSVTIVIHYIAAVALIFAVAYHIVYHVLRKEYDALPRKGDLKASYQIIKAMITKGQEPPSDKYLAEQRLAYAFIGVNLLLIIITGIIKVLKNLPTVDYSPTFLVWVNNLHTLASMLLVFGIVGHLAAFLFKENRALLPGMFTGKIDLEYVKHRHSLWYSKLAKQESSKGSRSNLTSGHACPENCHAGGRNQ
ncbi:formate dehydrogenase, gamma subunit [Desulforamulus putei DSM 12395]|uniref:Formate dehydrogenase, gamma subunit n=1 Tax=Desulforamulus putei DSM 12395 TaxID=1121429 RepID=A0A1M4T8S2_9FIRM|nr:cytochrome b/b6 domain-containing protein [Desulforamulus putei]SHE40810.1 formate dehydrogenase, gamma subunit [Desulforamulus putei DSM 12395]